MLGTRGQHVFKSKDEIRPSIAVAALIVSILLCGSIGALALVLVFFTRSHETDLVDRIKMLVGGSIMLLMAVVLFWLLKVLRRRWGREKRGACAECGYDRVGVVGRCPECGSGG